MTSPTMLQAVRMKGGLGDAGLIAAATGQPEATVHEAMRQALEDGLVTETRGRFRITASGRDQLDAALNAERDVLDTSSLEACYERFVPLNEAFKRAVADWQLRDGAPNDHQDADYDAAVLQRVADIDARTQALCAEVSEEVPRLESYRARFTDALGKLRDGDARYFASPMVDSYHQIWFEFHEELIGVTGRNRVQEAVEGRAD